MRHAYLAALHDSGSATPRTGWAPRFFTLWQGNEMVAACPLYLKSHSYGEYVFDWAWARAYEEHGLPYYPKAVVAVPFTPVPGTRLLARDANARALLVQAMRQWCASEGISSLHVLFASDDDLQACTAQGLMQRRFASINDMPIKESERKFFWPLGTRPADHPGLSDLGL